jgi:hypothetical protein
MGSATNPAACVFIPRWRSFWLTTCASLLLVPLVVPPALAQDSSFTGALPPDDYQAAGLGKLSPQEQAKLNQLVEAYKSGALAEAQRKAQEEARAHAAAEERARAAEAAAEQRAKKAEAAAEQARVQAAAAAQAAQTASAQAAAAKAAQDAEASKNAAGAKPSGGFLARAKAILTPGTQIEYRSLESRIVGSIRGWEPKTIFVLENGQNWQVADNTSYYNGGAVANPKVKISPAALFGFKMEIEGMGTMRVRLINGPTYKPN